MDVFGDKITKFSRAYCEEDEELLKNQDPSMVAARALAQAHCAILFLEKRYPGSTTAQRERLGALGKIEEAWAELKRVRAHLPASTLKNDIARPKTLTRYGRIIGPEDAEYKEYNRAERN